ncbi:ABC transporter substrate-binding protein [Marinobacterium alkalitolerans]|nr:ABC transporter substrate-binding protein [Marinobacterium alkalitolerans]
MRIRFRIILLGLLAALALASTYLFHSTTPLKLGTNLWPGYEPLYIARNLELLSEQDVALVELPSASEVMRAFRNGAIDAAALTLDEVINLRRMGLEPVIIQVTNISMGADVILARPGIDSFEVLKGKRVGLEASALGAYMISRALEINQMSPDDIVMVPLEVNDHIQAFRRGEVDALVTFDPVPQQIGVDQAVRLFDSSSLPGEIVDVIVVRQNLLEHKQVRRIIEAWNRTLAFIEAEPERSAVMMSERLGVSPQLVLQSLEGLELPRQAETAALMSGKAPPLEQQLQRLAAIMQANGLIDHIPELEGLVYSRYPE